MHHYKNAAENVNYLRGIDLSREVKLTSVSPGVTITQRTQRHRVDRPWMSRLDPKTENIVSGGEFVAVGGIQYVIPDGATVLQDLVR